MRVGGQAPFCAAGEGVAEEAEASLRGLFTPCGSSDAELSPSSSLDHPPSPSPSGISQRSSAALPPFHPTSAANVTYPLPSVRAATSAADELGGRLTVCVVPSPRRTKHVVARSSADRISVTCGCSCGARM